MAELMKELTHYGKWDYMNDILFYSSNRSVEDYKKIRMHPMVNLGLSMIKLGLPDAEWRIECDDEDIKEISTLVFKDIWRRMMTDGLEMLDYGWKASEVLWETKELKYEIEEKEKTWSGIVPKQPRGLDGETVEILTYKENGDLAGFWQDYEVERRCLIKDKKCLLFTNRMESGDWYGTAETEFIYMHWFDSNLVRQFKMRWLERKGVGTYIGTYPVGTTDDGTDNADVMLDLLETIMEGTAVALPSGTDESNNPLWDIKLLEPQDKSDSFIAQAKYNDEMILKGLVIPEKAVQQDGVGSYASVKEYSDLFIIRKQEILDRCVEFINRFIFQDFIKLNWAGVEAKLVSGQLSDNSKQTAFAIVQKLIENGTVKPERQWMMDKTDIPLEEEEEEPVGVFESNEMPLPKDNVIDIETGKKTIEKEDKKKVIQNEKVAMSEIENKFNFSDMESFLDSRLAEFEVEITQALEIQQQKVLNHIEKNYQSYLNKPIQFAKTVEIKRAPIKRSFKFYINDVYQYSYNEFETGIEGQSNMSESEFINFRSDMVSGKFADDLEGALQYSVSDNMSNKLSLSQILDNIKAIFGRFISARITTAGKTEGSFSLTKSIQDVVAENKKKVAKGFLPPEKAIKRFQYSAIMDSRTTQICSNLNGLVVDDGSSIMQEYMPPNHYNCRSVWTPVTQEEIDNPRVAGTDISVDKNGKPYDSKSIVLKIGKGGLEEKNL